MPSSTCVDAGILIKILTHESDSDKARDLWQQWDANEVERIAPTLFLYEVVSVLRKQVARNLLTPDEGEVALTLALNAPVKLLAPTDFHRRAWELAKQFNRPAAYDSHYLALAEMRGCEFWTADKRLYNAVKDSLKWVNWLGDFVSPAAAVTE